MAKVDASIIASHEHGDPDAAPGPIRISLLECPVCKTTLVAEEEQFFFPGEGVVWSNATRLWPNPEESLNYAIPPIVRESLLEAGRCMEAGAHTAAVAMCGRAMEGICRHFRTKNMFPGGGIEELKQQGVIDNRLLQWSQELHRHRNIAAHAGEEKISQQDATDLHTFVLAICEYIFDLSAKFEAFRKRQAKPE